MNRGRVDLILFLVFLFLIGTIPCRGNPEGADVYSGRFNETQRNNDEVIIHNSIAATGPFFFNVKLLGATGNGSDDDSEAIQEALTNAGNSGHGVVYLPEGTYLLKNPVTWERFSGSNALAGFVIRGDGIGKSVVLVDNETGGFRLDDFFSNTQFYIKDITLLAARSGAGTAISVGKHGNRTGARGYRCFFSENIEMKGQTPADYFNKGIDVLMTYRPLYRNILFTGSTLSGNEFMASVGIATDWCHTPEIEDCQVRNVHTAYSYLCSPADSGSMRPEGGSVHKSIADNCIIGIDIDKPGNMPELVINHCNIRARDIGIRISRIKFFQVRNNIFEPLVDPATHEYKDISTLGSFMGIYHYNIFKKFGRHSSEEELRTCLSFDDMDWRNDNSEMIIMNNLFPGTGTAVGGAQLSQMESSSIIKGNSIGTNLEAGKFRKFMHDNYHEPGYPLKSEITGPVFSVLDFGAQGDDWNDDADAFQAAVHAVIDSGGGILYIPAGKFLINKKIEVNLPENTSYRKIVFQGEGPGVSSVICNNSDAVFDITDNSGNVVFEFKNFGLYANKNDATAIRFESKKEKKPEYRTLIVNDIDIQAYDETFNQHIMFNNGIVAIGASKPYFENMLHKSYADPKYEAPLNDLATYGVYLENCDNITFIHCYVKRSKYGIYITGETCNNSYFYRTKSVGDFHGIYINPRKQSTGLWMESCHMNETMTNIYLNNIHDFVIIDNIPYGPTDNTRLTDIELVNCSNGRISGNVFHSPSTENSNQFPASERRAVVVRGANSSNILVENNIFNAKGKSVVVDENTDEVTVQDNLYPNPWVE